MGTSLHVTFPPLGDTSNATACLPWRDDVPLHDEAQFSRLHRRFLVSLFTTDRPGVLLQAVQELRQGLDLSASVPVGFSIDGSLSAAIHGTFSAMIVVRAYIETPGGEQLLRALPSDEIRAKLEDRLRGIVPAPGLEVYRLPHTSSRLFLDRQFCEYRFGAGTAASRLGRIARDFTARLGRAGIPIAYLNFPDPWREQPGHDWLRIGVGIENAPMSSIDADLDAVICAREHHCVVAKYDPALRGDGLGGRFHVLDDFSGPEGEHAPTAGPVDVVFLEGPAEVGYVAEMLSCAPDDSVLGGSMAVLAGHTVASWIVQAGAGREFLAKAREPQLSRQTLRGPAREQLIEGLDPGPTTHANATEFWVCWRCRETPGVLAKVLEETQAATGGPTSWLNVDRAVSRVLAQGQTCAGKLKFSLVSAGGGADLAAIQTRVHEALAGALTNWEPGREDWKSNPVLVLGTEPAADPWASLNLG